MADSALGKIDRAAKHVRELNQLFNEKRPFSYVVRTDISTFERSTRAKRNVAVVNEAADIAADVVHNLRTALDHAYWEIVSPFAKTGREQKAIQFPFCETSARLDRAVKNRLADRVSPSFFQALVDLKPHGENGGNDLLYSIHELDALDKHRFPIPTGDYKRIVFGQLRTLVPDIPPVANDSSTIVTGMNSRSDFSWTWNSEQIDRSLIGTVVPPTTHIFEKELPIPVDIVFAVRSEAEPRAMVPALHQMCDVARRTIEIIRASA